MIVSFKNLSCDSFTAREAHGKTMDKKKKKSTKIFPDDTSDSSSEDEASPDTQESRRDTQETRRASLPLQPAKASPSRPAKASPSRQPAKASPPPRHPPSPPKRAAPKKKKRLEVAPSRPRTNGWVCKHCGEPHEGEKAALPMCCGCWTTRAPRDADAAPAPAPKIKDGAEREGKKAKVHMEDLGFSAFADNVDVAPLRDFYGLVDFPWHLLVCRSDSNDASKKVLLVSPAAKRLVLRAKDHKLRVVHAGVVALQRTSASARGVVDYRLSQDGIDLVLPFMTKRKVKCSAADFALLTDGGAKRIADLSVAAEVDALDAGGLAFYLDGDEPPALVAWKGNAGHVTAFAAKDDLTVLKSKLEALGVEEAC